MVSAHSLNTPLVAHNDSAFETYTPDYRRKDAWAVLTAGGHLDFFHFAMFRQANLDSQDVTDGMRYIGYTRKFLEDLDVNLTEMFPSDHLVTNGWCYAQKRRRIHCLSASGREHDRCEPAGFAHRDVVQSAQRSAARCCRRTDFHGPGRQRLGASHPSRRSRNFTLTASPASVSPGGPVTVSWSGVGSPKARDWIGRYLCHQGTTRLSGLEIHQQLSPERGRYRNPPVHAPSRCPDPGTYQFRLFPDDRYTSRLAVSGTVIVH